MAGDVAGDRLLPARMEKIGRTMRYVPTAAITKDKILYVTGVSGRFYEMAVAGVSVSTDCLANPLYLATSPGRVDSELALKANGSAVLTGAIREVDTSAGAVGDPVYLAASAGGWTLTAPAVRRVIGHVAVVSATAGVINFDGRVRAIGGRATIDAASAAETLTFSDTSLAGRPVVATVVGTVADETAADATLTNILRAHWDGADLVLTGNANATANTLVSWMILL